jgi:HSP20 family protein
MTMTRWTPFFSQTLSDFDRAMKQLFQEFRLNGAPRRVLSPSFPPVNLWEDDDNLYVEAELPGVAPENLVVQVTEGNQLTLEGDRQQAAQLEGTWLRQERGFGKFSRLVELPVAVDADKVEARFDRGVLALKLPRAASAKPRRIAVQAE